MVKFGTIDLFKFNESKNLTSAEYNLETKDATLYYEILDNYITIDIGLTAKEYRLETIVTYSLKNETEQASLDRFYPLFYTKLAFEIPTTGILLKMEQDTLKFEDILLLNLDLSIRYKFKFGLGGELGYKLNQIKLDSKIDDFDKIDILTTGYYLAIIWDF